MSKRTESKARGLFPWWTALGAVVALVAITPALHPGRVREQAPDPVSGEPVGPGAGAPVSLFGSPPQWRKAGRTAQDGSYRISGLPPGTVLVRAGRGDGLSEPRRVTVTSGKIASLDISVD